MRNLSGEESLLAVLPIALVVIGLIAGILYYSNISGDNRSRASYPTTIIPSVTLSPKQNSKNLSSGPAIACSQLYSPICGVDGITYPNRCEMDIKSVAVAYTGECQTTTPKPTATTTPKPITTPKPTITTTKPTISVPKTISLPKTTTTPKPTINPNDLPSVENFR